MLKKLKSKLVGVVKNPVLRFKNDKGEDYPNWESKRLGEIGELQIGRRPKGGSTTEGVPSLGGEHIGSNHFITTKNIKYVPIDYFNKMTNGILKENDILIVKDGASAGKIGFYKGEYKQACINEHLYIVRSNINQYFLFNSLLTNIINEVITSYAVGVIAGINSSIKNILIPIPHIEEQNKIGKFLKSVDDKIEITNQKLNSLKTYKRALMQQLFPCV